MREDMIVMRKVLFTARVSEHIRHFHLPFIQMLEEMGCQVDVAAKVDVPLEGLIKGRVWDVPFARSVWASSSIKAMRAIRVLCEQERYDFVHTHTPIAAFMTRYALRNSGVPVIFTAHGFHFYKGAPLKNRIVYRMAEKIAVPWTAAILVMNAEDLELARELGYVEGVNLHYVHGVGLDLRYYSAVSREQARKSLEIPEEDYVAVCIGEFTTRKNHIQLLKAWKHAHTKIQGSRLLLVGRGELEDYLQRTVEGMDMAQSVRFLGYREDVPEILAAADVVVLTSRHEGLPRCIMEAMAAGKPVIATDVRGNRDLVTDGYSGYLVALDDWRTLADRIVQLADNPESMVIMGRAGRQKIQSYSIDSVLAEVNEIYARFIGISGS